MDGVFAGDLDGAKRIRCSVVGALVGHDLGWYEMALIEEEILNAEYAKDPQKTQRKPRKNTKMNQKIFNFLILYFVFCVLCALFAPSAFKGIFCFKA
jgi:hypothetical protein